MRGNHDPPTALVAAVAAALRDLPDLGHGVDISFERSEASSDAWIVMLDFADGSRTGFEVVASHSPGTLGAALVDGLQHSLTHR